MKLAFTTLGCPDWSWNKILDEAVRLGYQGIELRGIEGEFFLPKARPFLPENIEQTMAQLREKNLEICALDTSCCFHDAAGFDGYIEEGKRTIDLAEKLKVPYIRVFGNNVPDPDKKDEVLMRVVKGIRVLCDYCEGKNVIVLLETHGDFSLLEHLLPVLETVQSPSLGVLWDVEHTYTLYGEDNTEFFEKTVKYIKHTHVKDTRKVGDDFELCLTGQGNVPIKKDIEMLKAYGYGGFLSFEWEKKWHPELEEPEIAIPGFIDFINKLV
jgi:sugar phosphate isomerase/epimerase